MKCSEQFIGAMRLINTASLELEDFWDDRAVPKYAILSHTWGDQEVGFHDMLNRKPYDDKRWYKIYSACKRAAEIPLQWLWIDAICIDRTSTKDVSNAINSMFEWYKNAEVCLAYLADVSAKTECGLLRYLQAPAISNEYSRCIM